VFEIAIPREVKKEAHGAHPVVDDVRAFLVEASAGAIGARSRAGRGTARSVQRYCSRATFMCSPDRSEDAEPRRDGAAAAHARHPARASEIITSRRTATPARSRRSSPARLDYPENRSRAPRRCGGSSIARRAARLRDQAERSRDEPAQRLVGAPAMAAVETALRKVKLATSATVLPRRERDRQRGRGARDPSAQEDE
jgi:hypothetical protein